MLNYTDNGNGNVIVMIHGFCESLKLWDSFEQELSKYHRIICIDLPGFGDSVFLEDSISIDGMTQNVHNLLFELNIVSYSVIGHSLGGYVALALAENFPSEIESMVMFHTTAYADSEEKKLNRNKTAEFIDRNGIDRFMDSFVSPLFAKENLEKCKDKITELITDGKRNNQNAVIATIKAMRDRPDRTHVLANFNKPILWIIGENDVAVPLKDSLKLIEIGTKTDSLVLKNCGHMGMIEKPTTTLTKLKEFYIS